MQGAGAARAGAACAGAVRARAYAVCTHAVPVSILVLAVLVVRVLVQQLALCGRALRAGCVQRALGRCGRWPCAPLLHLANRVACWPRWGGLNLNSQITRSCYLKEISRDVK